MFGEIWNIKKRIFKISCNLECFVGARQFRPISRSVRCHMDDMVGYRSRLKYVRHSLTNITMRLSQSYACT